MTTELKFADYVVDAATLPQVSIHALLSRGFAHILGNEISAKIVARIRREIKGENKEVPTREQITAFREGNEDIVASWAKEEEEKVLQALADGTLGVRAPSGISNQRLDPLTREIRKIALAEVSAILHSNKLALPKGEGKVVFPNGEAFTRAELVERRLAKHGERIEKEAKKVLANVEKAVADLSDI